MSKKWIFLLFLCYFSTVKTFCFYWFCWHRAQMAAVDCENSSNYFCTNRCKYSNNIYCWINRENFINLLLDFFSFYWAQWQHHCSYTNEMDINELVLVPTTEQWSIASQVSSQKVPFVCFGLSSRGKSLLWITCHLDGLQVFWKSKLVNKALPTHSRTL